MTTQQKPYYLQDIDKSIVQSRSIPGGKTSSYLPVNKVTSEFNKTFSGNWSHEILNLKQDFIEPGKGPNRFNVCYTAHCRITVEHEGKKLVREEIGIGTAANQFKVQGIGNAKKSAISDAKKKCMKSFGEKFGLLLNEAQSDDQPQQQQSDNSNNSERSPSKSNNNNKNMKRKRDETNNDNSNNNNDLGEPNQKNRKID